MTSAIGGMNFTTLTRIGLKRRILARRSIRWAIRAAKLTPESLEKMIESTFGNLPSATVSQAQNSRDVILSVSTRLHGSHCLPRALATMSYCATVYKTRPEVVIGARTDPFQAHAWIRAENTVIDEFDVDLYFNELKVY